jgi:predicted metal-dependent hydrolase
MKVHVIQNNGKNVVCELRKRRNSKNIRMRIDNSGIVKVSLPIYTPYIFAKKFIKDNINWVESKLDKVYSQKDKYFYLGKPIKLIKNVFTNIEGFNYILNENELIIEVNNNSYSTEDLFIKWLREKADEYIPKRVEELSKKYGFDYNLVKIKNLNSRWGSCSSKKNLSFNFKLMYFNLNVIDYVIIHELCHLKELNHSKNFWKLVEGIIPNYKEYKLQLNNIIHK